MRFLFSFLLSFGVHVLIFGLGWKAGKYFSQFRTGPWPYLPSTPIEISLAPSSPPPPTNEKLPLIVRDVEIPDSMKVVDSEDQLTYLSEKRQRVKKSVRALLTGLTKNRKPLPLGQVAREKLSKEEDSTLSRISLHPTPISSQHPIPSQDLGPSTFGHFLPQDVSIGSFTALNTDQYLYYIFFSRIEERIRSPWENTVRQILDQAPSEVWSRQPSKRWTTELEIWLTPKGEYHSAHIMKSSGFQPLDQAVVVSFMRAKFFPNPPKEMIDESGLIRLKYAFRVEADPQLFGKNHYNPQERSLQ